MTNPNSASSSSSAQQRQINTQVDQRPFELLSPWYKMGPDWSADERAELRAAQKEFFDAAVLAATVTAVTAYAMIAEDPSDEAIAVATLTFTTALAGAIYSACMAVYRLRRLREEHPENVRRSGQNQVSLADIDARLQAFYALILQQQQEIVQLRTAVEAQGKGKQRSTTDD